MIGEPDTSGFSAVNEGSGPVNWWLDLNFPLEVEYEPFELRDSYNVSAITDDNRIKAIEFANGLLYVGGSTPDTNQIYVISPDGELIDQFDQPGNAMFGMPDMAWDGHLLWGSGEDMVYGFTTDGSIESAFNGPTNPSRNIAWDSDLQRLWISGTRGDIYGVETDGGEIAELDNPGLHINSLTYWPDAPDDYKLLIIHEDGDRQFVYRMNTSNGDTLLASELIPEVDGDAAGCTVTPGLDPFSWVQLVVFEAGMDDGDRIEVYELGLNTGWLDVTPSEGTLDSSEVQDYEVLITSETLGQFEYEAELIFTTDGRDAEVILPLTLNVLGPPEPPSDFWLIEPDSGDTIEYLDEMVIQFTWLQSVDPNPEDVVNYNFFIECNFDDSLYHYSWTMLDTQVIVDIDSVFWAWNVDPVEYNWWVVAISNNDTVECLERFNFYQEMPNELIQDGNNIPNSFDFSPLYPNPFNSQVTIRYDLPVTSHVTIEMFDIKGRLIRRIVDREQIAGTFVRVVEHESLPSGVYLYRLQAGDFIMMRKAALVR